VQDVARRGRWLLQCANAERGSNEVAARLSALSLCPLGSPELSCSRTRPESSRISWCNGLSSSARVASQTGMRLFTSSCCLAWGGIRVCWRVTETEGRAPGRALRARASGDTRVRALVWGCYRSRASVRGPQNGSGRAAVSRCGLGSGPDGPIAVQAAVRPGTSCSTWARSGSVGSARISAIDSTDR